MGMLNGHEFSEHVGRPLEPPPSEIALTHEQMLPDAIFLEKKHEDAYRKQESKQAWKDTRRTLGKPPGERPSNVYGADPRTEGGRGFRLPRFGGGRPKPPEPMGPTAAAVAIPPPEVPEGRVDPRAAMRR